MNIRISIIFATLFLSLFSLSCQEEGVKEMEAISTEQLHKQILVSPAKTVVVNVWASWCKPCVDEFPGMLAAYSEFDNSDVELMLVSVDFEDALPKAQQFLADQNVSFQTYRQEGNVENFITGLNPEWSGAIPATFIYSEDGELVDYWVGKASQQHFTDRINAAIN